MKKAPSGILPLISLDRKTSKPLHRQVYDAYRTAILRGSIRPGQRIPSTRVLASEIGISRFPVVNAYGQLLAEGYIESRVGAGTCVSVSLPEQLVPTGSGTGIAGARQLGLRPVAKSFAAGTTRARPWMRVWGAFRVGQVAFDQFPLGVWSRLMARRCRKMDQRSTHYGDIAGSAGLRRAVVNYLRTARSVLCEPSQVMIVNGSQQALGICSEALFDRGTRVWVEEPCYRLAREVFLQKRCHVMPVPVDDEGLDVAAGIRKCHKARAVFVTPSHQFPLGVTMSASRRLQLLEWAQSSGAWILEDDYDSEYRYESSPISSLQGLDANSRVIYIGTFSKVLFPSLRLGYIVIPPDLVDRFLAARRPMDLGTSTFSQEVLADFIDEGHFARHIRRMRVLYREFRTTLVTSLQEELAEEVEIVGDEAGMHLTVMLRRGNHDVEISERAARRGLSLFPLSPSYMGERVRQGFILGFGGSSTKEIPGAVRMLRTALR